MKNIKKTIFEIYLINDYFIYKELKYYNYITLIPFQYLL